jgi:hypothetical protein
MGVESGAWEKEFEGQGKSWKGQKDGAEDRAWAG